MKQILSFYKKYIPAVLLIMILLFGQAMCELALPGYMSDIINNGIVAGDLTYIKSRGIAMVAVSLASMVCAIGGGFCAAWASARISRNMRNALFRKVTSFSAAEMNHFSAASLITRSTNDIQMVQQTTNMMLRMALFAPMMGIGAVYKALHTSVSLSWTVGVALGVILCIMGIAFFAVLPKFRILQSRLDRLNLIMKERLAGVLVIRAFTTERQEEQRFDQANLDLTGINIFINRAMSFLMPALFFVMNAVSVLIVWAGAHLVEAEKLMIGDMLAYLQYAMHVIMSFLFVTAIFILIPRAMVSAHRINEVLEIRLSVTDKETPEKIEDPKGVVTFENAGFAYPGAEQNALKGISFTAEPGKTTAIIGGTGSGKSTLIQLIPRFYDVTEGRVLVDGHDVRNLAQRELRGMIGLVPQKGTLFSGTIAENLRYGDPDADLPALVSAAETAQAMEFIQERELGFDDPVAQGGGNVSGGQKQRLSIARALVRKPRVLIFDDSFSALDFSTDKALRKALRSAAADSTVIIVAQRINTILDADQIIVMDEGRVAGIGTHEELLAGCGVYQEIALSQLSEEELSKYSAERESGTERGRA